MKLGKLIGYKGSALDYIKLVADSLSSKALSFTVFDQSGDGFPVGCSSGNWITDTNAKSCNGCHWGYVHSSSGTGTCAEVSGYRSATTFGQVATNAANNSKSSVIALALVSLVGLIALN
jgi:hypothetical protein